VSRPALLPVGARLVLGEETPLPRDDDHAAARHGYREDMTGRVRAWWQAHPVGADVVLALAVFVIWAPAYTAAELPGTRGPLWVDILLSVAGVLPVALRRLSPWTAVGLLSAMLVLPPLLGRVAGAETLALLVVAYTAAAVLPLRQAVATTGMLSVAVVAAVLADDPDVPFSVWFSNALVLAVCFFVGRTVRTRRAYTCALEDRARAAEASREAAAREAVLDERRRIARELHDVVAHHISVMGVLATGARRTLYRDPGTADDTLRTIEDTGRTTLREMRRLLDILRTEDDAEGAPTAPQPGVAGLDALVAQVREAGLPVGLTVSGDVAALEPGVDLTVYRIVQEALTNALKHAGRASAEVRLAFTRERLDLEVTDDGRGPRPADGRDAGGHGLVGMRERVSLYGGRLYTGPRIAGGFVVRAQIPIEHQHAHPESPR
jgi:signal transduction histidine kinase